MIKIVAEKSKLIIPGIDSEIEYFDKSGRFKTKEGKWGLVDSSGKLLIKPIYDQIDVFYNHLALVKKNNKYGYIDDLGQQVVGFENGEPFLDKATSFNERGLAEVWIKNENFHIDFMGEFFEKEQPDQPKVKLLLKNKIINDKNINIFRNQIRDLHNYKKESKFKKEAEENETLEKNKDLIEIYEKILNYKYTLIKEGCSKILSKRKIQSYLGDKHIKIDLESDINDYKGYFADDEEGAVDEILDIINQNKMTAEKSASENLSGVPWFVDEKRILYIFEESTKELYPFAKSDDIKYYLYDGFIFRIESNNGN